jgi:hypothetical protein
LEHLPSFGLVVESIGVAAEEQWEEQENMLKRFGPSPISAVPKRAMEQLQQPEIILVPDESGSASPRVSSEDSDSEMQLPDPDESNVVITGNGVEIEYDGPMWTVPRFPFRDFGPRQPEPTSDWVTPAEQHMFGIELKFPVTWEKFKENLTTNGEHTFTVIEQKRYDECSVAPGRGNDVIVGSVLVISTDTMITTLKAACSGEGHEAYAGWNIHSLLKAIPFDSEVTILVESSDLMWAFRNCFEQEGRGVKPEECTKMPQWKTMTKMMRSKGIQMWAREFNEDENGRDLGGTGDDGARSERKE